MLIKYIVFVAVGFFLLVKGADYLVDGACGIARRFHIPEMVIGLTLVAIGTSMPELFVSAGSALKGQADMSIGNVIGSNICNIWCHYFIFDGIVYYEYHYINLWCKD